MICIKVKFQQLYGILYMKIYFNTGFDLLFTYYFILNIYLPLMMIVMRERERESLIILIIAQTYFVFACLIVLVYFSFVFSSDPFILYYLHT